MAIADTYYEVRLTDGSTQEVFAEPRTHDGVLHMVSHYGDGFEKERVSFPLVNVLWWRKRDRQ